MRTYYAFLIKDSLVDFYSKRPYSLYRILEQIYKLKNNDIVLGYRLLEQVTNHFGCDADKFLYKRHYNELEYSKIDNRHIIKNLYSEEVTFLKVFHTHIKMKTNNNYSSFFETMKEYNKNIFIYTNFIQFIHRLLNLSYNILIISLCLYI